MRTIGYKGYIVYENGQIWRPSMVRTRKDGVSRRMPGGWQFHSGKVKGPGVGYRYVTLWVDNKAEYWLVHRLVAILFIPNPEGKPEVNHIDGDRTNNCVSNLEWVTRRENLLHTTRVLKRRTGANHVGAKLTTTQVTELRYKRNILKLRLSDLAVEYGVAFQTVSAIARGDRYAFES